MQLQQGDVTRLQIFLYVPTSILARPPDCTYPKPFNMNLLGNETLYTMQLPGFLPAPGYGIAIYPNWAIGITGPSPARVQPCRLLHLPSSSVQLVHIILVHVELLMRLRRTVKSCVSAHKRDLESDF